MGNFKVLQQNDNRVPQKATEKETGRVDGVLQIFAPVVPYICQRIYAVRLKNSEMESGNMISPDSLGIQLSTTVADKQSLHTNLKIDGGFVGQIPYLRLQI